MNKITYVDVAETVIARINHSIQATKDPDPDGLLARKWADEYFAMKGNYSGIDGYIDARFREIGRPEAAHKFIRFQK